jgi:plasmid stabilization system protein ParE
LFSTIRRWPISKISSIGSRKTAQPAAKAVVDRLFGSAELLISFPLMGHVGRVSGTFEWVVPRLPYIVVYEVDQAEGQVIVTAVFHGAQDREGE